MIGISVAPRIGLGDGLQFSSLPENYFRATGKKLFDLSRVWFFDHNPYVERELPAGEALDEKSELWNFGPTQYPWPRPREKPPVYLSNAEIWAARFKVPVVLNRPRLYHFEDFPFDRREVILFHPVGKSHGPLPDQVVDHVLKKYKNQKLLQVGLPSDPGFGIPRLETPTMWDLAAAISRCRMFIGPDSGPSWIAACFPDIVIKKVRVRHPDGQKPLTNWVPLEIEAHHSHWDDRAFQIFNTGEDDMGFTQSYKKI